ncbi:MAG: pyruvate dehydrogenase [Rhodobacteraceae bacterium]|nr:MAG: pyruvate dehydrogenase [Paracoccaceae bacterium]
MPHDVTMPQLGMAQDAGRLVAWLKAPGAPVTRGEALFEVETDKATMEVEAQADGYLTAVSAAAGEDIPVGAVIARISESVEEDAAPPAKPAPAAETLPMGKPVTMPQLGMAQDSGILVSWQKAPGEAVAAGDVLFEVETDKATMEVEAGHDGWLAATLAEAGEAVPVGAPVAIISAEASDAPVARSMAEAAKAEAPAEEPDAKPDPKPAPKPAPKTPPTPVAKPAPGGPVLASPKARRLALEQGLDLARLVEAGHPQPYHVRDLEVLRALPAPSADTSPTQASRRLLAEVARDGLPEFAAWAAETHGLEDADALLAGLAAACLPDAGLEPGPVAVERLGRSRSYLLPASRQLGAITETDAPPVLVLRDLRGTALRQVEIGGEATPVLTLAPGGPERALTLTLECAAAGMTPGAAIQLLSDVAGRVEQPLRHLL